METKACMFRWDYPVLNLQRSEARTCCRVFPRNITMNELSETKDEIFLNSLHERTNRLNLIKGEKVSDCHACWDLESKGMWSPRTDSQAILNFWNSQPDSKSYIDQFKLQNGEVDWDRLAKEVTIDSPLVNSYAPRMIEISLGNLCDMKCIYCSHHYSSAWAKERLQFNEIPLWEYEESEKSYTDKYNEHFWKWFEEVAVHSMEYLTILGGEPLINPQFYEFLDRIENILRAKGKSGITLSIVTNLNMSEFYLSKFINSLQRLENTFAKIDINVSMESVYEKAEYIRFGLNWKRWEKNLKTILGINQKNIAISLQMAINALNVTSLKPFLSYILDHYQGYTFPLYARQNIVSTPAHFSTSILPSSFSSHIKEAADFVEKNMSVLNQSVDWDWGRWDRYHYFLTRLENTISQNKPDPVLNREFKKQVENLDFKRKTNFVSVFPEYKEFWNSI